MEYEFLWSMFWFLVLICIPALSIVFVSWKLSCEQSRIELEEARIMEEENQQYQGGQDDPRLGRTQYN